MAFSDHFWEGALYTDSATGLLLSPPFCHTPILSQVESYPVEYMSRGERLCPGLVASLGWLRTSALSPCCSLSFRLLSLSHPLHNSGSFSFDIQGTVMCLGLQKEAAKFEIVCLILAEQKEHNPGLPSARGRQASCVPSSHPIALLDMLCWFSHILVGDGYISSS